MPSHTRTHSRCLSRCNAMQRRQWQHVGAWLCRLSVQVVFFRGEKGTENRAVSLECRLERCLGSAVVNFIDDTGVRARLARVSVPLVCLFGVFCCVSLFLPLSSYAALCALCSSFFSFWQNKKIEQKEARAGDRSRWHVRRRRSVSVP